MESQGLAPSLRSRIVQLAAERFARKGYSDTSTRELSEAVGLQKASLYHHYASKELILHEICVSAIRNIHEVVSGARDVAQSRSASPSDVLIDMVEAHMGSALGHRYQHATMLIELRHLTGANLEEVLAARSRYEDLFYQQILLAQEREVVRNDMSARVLTLGLLNLLNWTIFWYSEDGPASPADLAHTFTRIFLEGVVPRSPEPPAPPAGTTQ